MAKVVYDLTEVFIASTGKFPYYGIVRVVEEIGCELYRIDPEISFGIFSYAQDSFFEIHPLLDGKTGRVELNVPQGVKQFHHLRRRFYEKNKVRDLLLSAVQMLVHGINLFFWKKANISLRPLDINGKILVATGRPKHMVAALDALDRADTTYKFIPLLHDMFPLYEYSPKKPRSFSSRFLGDNRHVIEHSSKIITNSEFTKSEIEKFSQKGMLPLLPEIMAVPLVQECRAGTELPTQDLPKDPYILMVGASLGRKNLEVVFKALRLLETQGRFIPCLVLAGALRRRTEKYLAQDQYHRIKPHVQIVLNPHQTDLTRLYSNAMALILPSRMEGWGLPAGEALWNGTPVICSTAPVLHEVCGDLGLYFDPDNPAELAALITRLHEDKNFDDEVRARIAAQSLQLRTWADVAKDVKRVYESL